MGLSFDIGNGGDGGNGSSPPSGVPAANWKNVNLGQNMFWFYLTTYIGQTGAAVTTDLELPFNFKLIAILLEHTDASDALSADALTWSFNIRPRVGLAVNFPIVTYTNSGSSGFYEEFGDNYVYPKGSYVLSTNTTNTDRVRVHIIVQKRQTV